MSLSKKIKGRIARVYHATNAAVFARKSYFQFGDSADKSGMTEIPFYPPNVLEGDPRMRSKAISSSGDGGFVTGMWDCTAGRFMWHFNCDEVVHIIDGEVTVKVNDQVQRLVKGSVAYFPIGTVSEWHVPNYVLKIFSHHNPTPTLQKIFGG